MSDEISEFLLSAAANVVGTVVGGVLVLFLVERWFIRKLDQWNSPEAVEARRVKRELREERGDAFGEALEEAMRRRPSRQRRSQRAAGPE
jgi:hypothetical protein